jgi:hypothetical protein
MSRRFPKKLGDGDSKRRRNSRKTGSLGSGKTVLPVTDGGLVDVELVRERLLGKTGGRSEDRDSLVDSALARSLRHASIVDIFSTKNQDRKRISPTGRVQLFESMGDKRHPKPYPKGPKKEVTDDWLARVDHELKRRADANETPASRAALMVAIGRDKTAMTQLWGSPTRKRAQTSKLVEPISRLLGIASSTIETPPDQDELEIEIRNLDPAGRAALLTFLKSWKRQP